VEGYESAIEFIAAELHSRRDWILNYCTTNGLAVSAADSDKVDFLTYARYNNKDVSIAAANNLSHYMRKYVGTERSDQENVRFNTLLKLATADWIKELRVYEI
jgi:hypothetical protein